MHTLKLLLLCVSDSFRQLTHKRIFVLIKVIRSAGKSLRSVRQVIQKRGRYGALGMQTNITVCMFMCVLESLQVGANSDVRGFSRQKYWEVKHEHVPSSYTHTCGLGSVEMVIMFSLCYLQGQQILLHNSISHVLQRDRAGESHESLFEHFISN